MGIKDILRGKWTVYTDLYKLKEFMQIRGLYIGKKCLC